MKYSLRIEKDHTNPDEDIKVEFKAETESEAFDMARAKAVAELPEDHTAWCVLSAWCKLPSGFSAWETVDEFEAN